MGLHVSVRAGVHEHQHPLPPAPARHLAFEDQRTRGDQGSSNSLALVAGVGARVSMVANPFFGRMSDRTSSRLGHAATVDGDRPDLAVRSESLVLALAPNIPFVLLGWCMAQLFFNALLAAQVAVLPDEVQPSRRGLVSGVLGVCLPAAAVSGTFLVRLVSGNQLATFLVPCGIGGFFILLFAVVLKDRRLAKADRLRWSLREFARTFYVAPRREPGLRLGFRQPLHVHSRLRVPGHLPGVLPAPTRSAVPRPMCRNRYSSAPSPIPSWLSPPRSFAASCLTGRAGGRFSSSPRRSSYGVAMFAIAIASTFNGFLVGMAIRGTRLRHVHSCRLRPGRRCATGQRTRSPRTWACSTSPARFPFSIAPAIAPAILAIGSGSYTALYAIAGVCAVIGAVAILRVRGVR